MAARKYAFLLQQYINALLTLQPDMDENKEIRLSNPDDNKRQIKI